MTTTDPAVAELIREVLAEELARLRADVREERVRIADDADLAAFARRVLAMAGDREAREALESGRLVFRLDTGAGGAASAAGRHGAGDGRVRGGRAKRDAITASLPSTASTRGSTGHTETIERGLVSERLVDRLPRGTARVRLGRARQVDAARAGSPAPARDRDRTRDLRESGGRARTMCEKRAIGGRRSVGRTDAPPRGARREPEVGVRHRNTSIEGAE